MHTKIYEGNQIAIHSILLSLFDFERYFWSWLFKLGDKDVHFKEQIEDVIVVTP